MNKNQTVLISKIYIYIYLYISFDTLFLQKKSSYFYTEFMSCNNVMIGNEECHIFSFTILPIYDCIGLHCRWILFTMEDLLLKCRLTRSFL